MDEAIKIIISAKEYLEILPQKINEFVTKIREEKLKGIRQIPSSSLIDNSKLLNPQIRSKLIDKVALLVDENLVGRSEMCIQFAILLCRALEYLGLPSKVMMGTAMYFDAGREIFRWDHSWVRIDDEVIDGNVDILLENPMVPETVTVKPYWGPVKLTPRDRRLRENRNTSIPEDADVENIWWADLKQFIDNELIVCK